MIRSLLLKVDTLSLEDSLLMIESREAKKAPEEIKVTPPKGKVAEEPKPKEDVAEDTNTTETE